jgi:competence protein ComEA
MASNQPPVTTHSQGHADQHISQQQTIPHLAANSPLAPLPIPLSPADPTLLSQPSITRRLRVIIPIAIVLLLLLGIYFVWNASTTSSPLSTNSSGITQQNFGNGPASTSSNAAATTSSNSGNIQVYIVGAVLHPGVYTLAAGARVYALLQAAGGPLPKANLVALNLAAKLTDGEEVYVTMIGEIPPTYLGGVPGPGNGTPNNAATGQLVNINTASADEMRQNLHVSSTTAQNIVNYRTQHGPFSSIDQLLQVVSKSIYDHIKGLVTIS